MVNNSRGIIFAHRAKPVLRPLRRRARWQEAVEAATRDMIDQLRRDARRAPSLIPLSVGLL